jgi:cation transport ATPase
MNDTTLNDKANNDKVYVAISQSERNDDAETDSNVLDVNKFKKFILYISLSIILVNIFLFINGIVLFLRVWSHKGEGMVSNYVYSVVAILFFVGLVLIAFSNTIYSMLALISVGYRSYYFSTVIVFLHFVGCLSTFAYVLPVYSFQFYYFETVNLFEFLSGILLAIASSVLSATFFIMMKKMFLKGIKNEEVDD